MAREGSFSLVLPAGPLAPGVSAAQPAAELSDAEADALWSDRRPVRATRPADGEQMHAALSGDTTARTPDDARGLGW